MAADGRVYVPSEVVVFQKTRERWGALSNMAAGFPLVVGGEEWLTSEAVYQACRFPDLPDVQRLIMEQASPMAAKMRSKPHRGQTRPDWDSTRTLFMRWVLRVKLAQNFAAFSAILAQTGELPIVERSHRDRFWGTVLDHDGLLKGANVLGRLLMELRAEMWTRERIELLTVEPPDVPNFRVLGQTVGVVSDRDRPVRGKRLF